MKIELGAILLVATVMSNAFAETCTLEERTVHLTPELLGQNRFEPQSAFMSHVNLEQLRTNFKGPVGYEIPINRQGETKEVRLVPLEIEITAKVESARTLFLNEIRRKIPRSTKYNKYRASGGHMRLVDGSRLQHRATIKYRKKEKIFFRYTTVLKVDNPVNLNIEIERKDENATVAVDFEMQTGKPKIIKNLYGDILDVVLAPLTALSLAGLFESPSVLFLEEAIEGKIEGEVRKHAADLKSYVNNNFDMDDVDGEIAGDIVLFSNIFSERLRHTERTGFTGTNTRGDAEITLTMHKVSIEGDPKTHVTYETACTLEEAMNRLAKRAKEIEAKE